MKKNNKQGFTIIEILVIIAIIAVLVSVILVSMIKSREKAQDNAAFASFKSAAAPAFMCLSSGDMNAMLTNPLNSSNICNPSNIAPDSVWPDISRTEWSYNHFVWCDIAFNGETHPESCGSYTNGSCGGNNGSELFCFMMQKDNKYMWCTAFGCRKEGF